MSILTHKRLFSVCGHCACLNNQRRFDDNCQCDNWSEHTNRHTHSHTLQLGKHSNARTDRPANKTNWMDKLSLANSYERPRSISAIYLVFSTFHLIFLNWISHFSFNSTAQPKSWVARVCYCCCCWSVSTNTPECQNDRCACDGIPSSTNIWRMHACTNVYAMVPNFENGIFTRSPSWMAELPQIGVLNPKRVTNKARPSHDCSTSHFVTFQWKTNTRKFLIQSLWDVGTWLPMQFMHCICIFRQKKKQPKCSQSNKWPIFLLSTTNGVQRETLTLTEKICMTFFCFDSIRLAFSPYLFFSS